MSELSNYIDEYLKTEYTLKSTLKDSVQSSVYLYQKNDSAKQIVKISQKNRNDHVLRRLRGQLNKNTATIYEVCSNDEDVTVLEEYINGATLRHIVEANGGTLKRELAVKYALDICNGLVFIHSLGIIHRDIKPSNIIITEQGEAVIIDFGSKTYRRQQVRGHQKFRYCRICGTGAIRNLPIGSRYRYLRRGSSFKRAASRSTPHD